jgi:NTP pyrophosphatase (non-canonical NTP hydrolase)
MTHKELVTALVKPGQNIVDSLTPRSAHLLHMAAGISGEAGEILDAIKKVAIYGKEVDREHVVEELGDLEFYMEGMRQELGITREETLEHNISKLTTRYHSLRYSDQHAIERVDKTGD